MLTAYGSMFSNFSYIFIYLYKTTANFFVYSVQMITTAQYLTAITKQEI